MKKKFHEVYFQFLLTNITKLRSSPILKGINTGFMSVFSANFETFRVGEAVQCKGHLPYMWWT